MERISSVSSILRTAPLICRVYLLTAVWVMPKSSAMSFCFMLYDCVSSVATKARMDGTTDFTATSHGMNMCGSPLELWYCLETYISMTYVIFYMTYVLGEETNDDRTLVFSPFSSLFRCWWDVEPLAYA